MVKPNWWRLLLVAASFAVGSVSSASAQLVIGESNQPNVVIDWSVMERLGEQPSLADMLREDIPTTAATRRVLPQQPSVAQVQNRPVAVAKRPAANFTPYKPGAKPAAKPTQRGKFVPYQPSAARPLPSNPSLAATTYQPGKFIPYQPAAPKAAAKPAKAASTESGVVAAKPNPSKREDVAESVAKTESAAKVETVAASVPAIPAAIPSPVAAVPTTDPAPIAAVTKPMSKLPEPESLKAVQDAIKSSPVKDSVAALEQLKEKELPAVSLPSVTAPAVVASAAPALALPSIVTPPPAPAAIVPAAIVKDSPKPSRSSASTGGLTWNGDSLVIPYNGESVDLTSEIRAELDELTRRMQKQESMGLQLLAYADGDDANSSRARRLSLSRALEVRKYLMDQGVRSTRIEVRALGNKQDGNGPANRVEALMVGR